MKINLREIQLSKSRPTVPDVVNALSQSMASSGLISPIIVKKSPIFDGVIMTQGYKVIAGNHRVSAARALGWTDIEAFLHDGDELQAELMEIDENLQRAEFTPAQRAAAIHRRKELWEAMHPPEKLTQVGSVSKGGRGNIEFAADVAAKTGHSKTDTNRHLARAESLGSDIHEVIGTSLDKGVELDALKDMDAEQRRSLIARAKTGENVSARPAANDDPAKLDRLVGQVLGELARLPRAGSAQDVAEVMAKRAINPDLRPYLEAIYNAFRAKARVA